MGPYGSGTTTCQLRMRMGEVGGDGPLSRDTYLGDDTEEHFISLSTDIGEVADLIRVIGGSADERCRF